ncbi:hypothetical protein IC229_34970 [Spirosoma sp. BT702]|uniref:Uncharacterized protein n=1 Tax=Spirosoma profusum TaxID=2771354 RepID=A0A927AWQ5_9BACT|nr:hypothetical protein [Spirosoma profusum]MBD2705853.1 hypothetical protein [Spirosoma profusum]
MTAAKSKTNGFYPLIRSVFLVVLLSGISGNVAAQVADTILVQNHYYPKPGKEDEVYKWRLHASEVRSKLGLPKGRVLKKLNGTGGPFVIWECEYPSPEARQKDVAVLDQSEEFKQVQAHMTTLLDKFERYVFSIH